MAGGGGLNDLSAIRGGNGAAIYNYGLWDAQSDQTFNDAFGGATVFNNSGVVRKSAGAGNTIFAGGVLFNQTSGGSVTSSGTGTTYLNAGNFNIVGTAGSLTPKPPATTFWLTNCASTGVPPPHQVCQNGANGTTWLDQDESVVFAKRL